MTPRAESFRWGLLTYGPLLAALLIEVLAFEVIGARQGNPGFASINNLMLVLNQSSIHGVMAVGMTFVIITGGIDLSVGSLLALCGVLCAMVVRAGGDPVLAWLVAGWALAMAAGAASGAVAGLFITRLAIPPFIVTLALMSSLRGLANLMTDGKPISPLPEAYAMLGRHQIGGVLPITVLIFLVVLAMGIVLLHFTRFGRHVLAIGGNEETARLSGIPIARVKLGVYLLGGVLTAIAGIMLSSKLGSGSPKVGVADELAVIAAVVVGGTSLAGGRGSIIGTFVGLIVVSVLNSGLTWIGVETFGQQVTLGLVILAAVLLDRFKDLGTAR
ncbi:MAG: ribose transporter permease [Candidatus Hydrogenedentota bacterium]|jgi:ribose/xylose/arabinose/galactoside ABC-type transport system permease subunit